MGNVCLKSSNGRKKVVEDEFSEEDIRRKYHNVPKLTYEEKMVLKSSWKAIRRRIDEASVH